MTGRGLSARPAFVLNCRTPPEISTPTLRTPECDRLMFIPASQGRKNTTRRCFLTVASAPCGLWRGGGADRCLYLASVDPCRCSGAGGRFAAGASPYPHPKNRRGLATSAADGRLLPDVVAKNVTKAGLKMPPVVALYSPPPGMSPGYLRFITRRKYDDVAFSSDLLALVAKRGMAVSGDSQHTPNPWLANAGVKQRLTRLPVEGNRQLNYDDRQLLSTLFKGKQKNIDLSKAHQRSMQTAREEQEKRCEAQRDKLFRKWGQPLRRCIYIALLVPVACGLWVNTEAALLTIPAAVFMLIGGAMLACLLRFICRPREMWRAWGPVPLFFWRSSAPSRRWEAGFFSLVYCPSPSFRQDTLARLWPRWCSAFSWPGKRLAIRSAGLMNWLSRKD